MTPAAEIQTLSKDFEICASPCSSDSFAWLDLAREASQNQEGNNRLSRLAGPIGLKSATNVTEGPAFKRRSSPMDRPRKIHKRRKEEYRMRTHLIHGNYESRRWDYDH